MTPLARFLRPAFALLVVLLGTASVWASGPSLGLVEALIVEPGYEGAFPLIQESSRAPLCHDSAEHAGVIRALGDLQADVQRVSGAKPMLSSGLAPGPFVVLVGTRGKSSVIDELVAKGKLQLDELSGKRESFVITTVTEPMPGVRQALVIAGSDKRGTIYGIYELSEQLGVSPWYWWADVPVRKRSAAFVKPGRYFSGEPAVRYRGIFLNDEDPALSGWAREKFGGVNSKMYAHVFELLLRLRGNYLWPAMWGKAFNEDDPENPRLADEYGIVMGTSHHEPMMRAQKEWSDRKAKIGNGRWDYVSNRDGLSNFFREGIERNKRYENLITIGMRGDGDEPMVKEGDLKDNIALLEQVVADQRRMISEVMKSDPAEVPQVWALYKEVSDYYDHGMKVPDDVTLLWCDDNWGNIRRVPTAKERERKGGAGVYYHFDYVGSPRCYKWINTNPLPKIWEQMTRAYLFGADRIWIVNVGDLKPMELPIEFFLRLAWNPKAIGKDSIAEFTRRWAAREFGENQAQAIAELVSKYAKYNAWRKPELLERETFSLVNYHEAERVLKAWRELCMQAERVYAELPMDQRAAYYQLVLYPVKASANLVELHIETGRNQLYAAQGRVSASTHAKRVRDLFRMDQELTTAYHELLGGKWNHMMAQTHIGYTSWKDPKQNVMPSLAEVKDPAKATLGVSVQGSASAWPGASGKPSLPTFDSIKQQSHWVDVFRRGQLPVEFKVSVSKPWVMLDKREGVLDQDERMWVRIDWAAMPSGEQEALVTVSAVGGERVEVQVKAIKAAMSPFDPAEVQGGLSGPIAIEAEQVCNSVAVGGVRWERIPDYGRGRSGLSIFPMDAPSVTSPAKSPYIEYKVYLPVAGEYAVNLITGPSLCIQPGSQVRIAVSFDDKPPRMIDAFLGQSYAEGEKRGDSSSPAIKDWGKWVRDNARTMSAVHKVEKAGVHTLRVWMVDANVVLQKIIIHNTRLGPSYFGPTSAD